ncbi:MAG: F0F1 ATP synthase subunit A [Streptococcaceae bacterium]|jgi:F-type H+-transporting ATPase subunit a|nr:F0F1 ATP synthase subunit A [Streptococcaceae bacterium]
MEQNPILKLGPLAFNATLLYMTALSIVIVFVLVFIASRKMTLRPAGKQNVLEYVVELSSGIARDNLGAKEAPRFSLFNFVLFSFLLIANNIGLLTHLEVATKTGDLSYWSSPTSNATLTLTFAMLVLVLANGLGVQQFGFGKYFKNAFIKDPVGIMLPLGLLEEFTNTLSLGLRIYGNIMAGEVMLGLICQLGLLTWWTGPIGVILATLWIAFSIFISALQAYIFVLLSNIYISHKILEED